MKKMCLLGKLVIQMLSAFWGFYFAFLNFIFQKIVDFRWPHKMEFLHFSCWIFERKWTKNPEWAAWL